MSELQKKFAKAYAKSEDAAKAAIAAGYSPKNPAQSGYQALEALRNRGVKEICNELGFGVPEIIHTYLAPMLKAKETKYFAHEGKVCDERQVDALDIQDRAIDKFLRLHGAYAPKDPELAAQVGVKVIVIDVPRPSEDLDDILPGPNVPKRLNGSGNGHKS